LGLTISTAIQFGCFCADFFCSDEGRVIGKGEILNLKWSQIRNGFISLQKTKTDEPRQIPLKDDLDRMFKQIRKEHQLASKHVFLYDGQIFNRKTGEICMPKKER